MEECDLLTEARGLVEKEEMREWKSRHARNKIVKREKGPVGPGEEEKEKEEEDKLETFFCKIHEFHIPVPVAPVFVPAELPPRYAISFVPAAAITPGSVNAASPVVVSVPPSPYSVVSSANVAVPVPSAPRSATSSPFSVVSSANFVFPATSASSTHCMPTT